MLFPYWYDQRPNWASLGPLDFTWIPVVQAPVVQSLEDAIHWINLYLVDGLVFVGITYPLDNDLSVR